VRAAFRAVEIPANSAIHLVFGIACTDQSRRWISGLWDLNANELLFGIRAAPRPNVRNSQTVGQRPARIRNAMPVSDGNGPSRGKLPRATIHLAKAKV
jgi:hypothetical protein